MNGKLRIPIRLKILVSLLFVVTAVVSTITFTMANLFHQDKRAYINDVVATVALAAADEARSTLIGYAERLRVYARIAGDASLRHDERASLVEGMFEDFPGLIAVRVLEGDRTVADAHNAAALEQAGLAAGDLTGALGAIELSKAGPESGGLAVGNASLAGLPALAIGVAAPTEGENPRVVVGITRLDALQRITARSRAFDVFLIDGAGILLAHPDVSRVLDREPLDLGPASGVLGDPGRAAITVELQRAGIPMIGAYADAGIGGIVAGAEIPRSAAFLASRVLLRRLLLVALSLLVVSAVVGLLWSHRLTRPVTRLSRATREIGQGNFDVQVDVRSRDEIGELARSFNRMAGELDDRDKALEQAQAQLLHSEKMAAFGQLGAGIAHEVKNPLAGILGCAQLALRKTEHGTPVHQNLELIQKETRRCKTIIESLLKFARQEKAEFSATDLYQVVGDSVAIVRHQLELKKIDLRTDMEEGLPGINGNANQLEQVLINLLVNAGQALDGEPGEVTVAMRRKSGKEIEISVRDSGPGMNEEVRARVFEPFYTTKPGGKGTGLGLSVSFGIIRDHGGAIEVDSRPGEGATFRISLPVAEAAAVTDAPRARTA